MSRTKEVNLDEVAQPELSREELKAQLAAEIRAEIEAEKQAEIKALEEKIQLSESNLEAQIREEEKTVKQQLKDMEQVWIEIPEDQNPDDIVPVGFNGVIYSIPKGQRFKVPSAIYDIWKESHEKTKAVNKRIRESTKKEITVV